MAYEYFTTYFFYIAALMALVACVGALYLMLDFGVYLTTGKTISRRIIERIEK